MSEQFLADLNVNDNTPMVETISSNAQLVTDIATVPPPDWDSQFDPARGVDSYKDFTNHPVLIHHFTWDGAATGSLVLTQNLIRRYFTVAPPALKNRVNTFYFLRSQIKLTFVVQGAAQCAGMLAFTAYPLPKSGLNNTSSYTNHNVPANSRISPHVLIDPSKSESLELILPVCTTTGYYNVSSSTAGTDENGSYELDRRVLVPLTTGTANSADISVCVYMSLVDPIFVGLREIIALAPLMTEKKPGGSLSSIAFGVSKIANVVRETFPTLGPTATIFSSVAGAAGAALQFLGFSKPQASENLVVVMNRQADNYSQVDGKSTALVLGRSQGQTVSIAPGYIGGSLDEMTIDHLCSIPAIADTFSITASSATQTLVHSIPVHPNLRPARVFTPLAGLASIHQLWCGDMSFTFEFIASVFHRATVLIAWAPAGLSAPTFANALNTLKNTTVYISGNTSVTVTIPWTQTQPAKSTINLSDRINGTIWIYVVNPLQANGSTDPIYVNVLTHSDNMAFMLPYPQGAFQQPEYRVYSEDLFDFTPAAVVPLGPPIDWVEPVQVSFGPPTNIAHIASAITGDRTLSIKDLLSRMVPTMDVGAQGADNTLRMRPIPMTTGGFVYQGYYTQFVHAFVGARGSFRTTLVPSGPTPGTIPVTYAPEPEFNIFPGAMWYVRTMFQALSLESYALTSTNTRVSANIDVVVPMTIPTLFYPGRNSGSGGSGLAVHNQGYAGLLTFGPMPAGTDPVILKGAGDDYVMSGFIGFPQEIAPP